MFEEPRLTDQNRPACPICGIGMTCHDCEDIRPTAEQIYKRCRIMTPLGRWETVEHVDRQQYGPVIVVTKESGLHRWRYRRDDRPRFTEPRAAENGTPEVRLVEQHGRDGSMFIVAISSANQNPMPVGAGALAYARYARSDRSWVVETHDAAGESVTHQLDSKARARAKLRELGRSYAKQFGVAFTTGE